jgi:hypothetical protein
MPLPNQAYYCKKEAYLSKKIRELNMRKLVKNRQLAFSILGISLFAVGCAASNNPASLQDRSANSSAAEKSESMKLYEWDYSSDGACDVYSKMDLIYNADKMVKATVKDAADGACRISKDPTVLDFAITKIEKDSCGSKFYSGSTSSGAIILIKDHRTRLCEDMKPARIEVRIKNGQTMKELEIRQ